MTPQELLSAKVERCLVEELWLKLHGLDSSAAALGPVNLATAGFPKERPAGRDWPISIKDVTP